MTSVAQENRGKRLKRYFPVGFSPRLRKLINLFHHALFRGGQLFFKPTLLFRDVAEENPVKK